METAKTDSGLIEQASPGSVQTHEDEAPRRTSRDKDDKRAKLVPDRRRFKRVSLRLLGRFMRADTREYPCQLVNMSPGDMAILSPIAAELGERIVVYVDHVGRIEGEVVRIFKGGFALMIHAGAYKREKLANQLTWLINREHFDSAEERTHERVVPKKALAKLVFANGDAQDCRVLDVSLSGASVAINPKPEIGTEVVLGLMRGQVVRHHDQGIGIRFSEIQNPDALERNFG